MFRDNMNRVATLHVPEKYELIKSALKDKDFMVNTMTSPGIYYYE